MLPNKTRAEKRAEVVQKNSIILKKIISDSIDGIHHQGTGCYIEDYGVDYIDPKTKFRDSIGVLVPFYSGGKLKRHFGLISDESQKPIVRVILKTYNININIPTEYNRLVWVLREIQYAHDESFDHGKGDMLYFIERCNRLKETLW